MERAQRGEDVEGIIGAAFYSKQDGAALAEAWQRRAALEKAAAAGVPNLPPAPVVRLWLSYTGNDGKPSAQVGEIVSACLRESGLAVDWSPDSPAMAVYL